MERKALGRGLEALLPQSPVAAVPPPGIVVTEKMEQEPTGGLTEVGIDRVRPNPRQPRESFNEEALASMAASLRDRGMLQPLVVRREGEGFQLIAGERRWRAAQRAGWQRVPVIVREATTLEALELALIENVQREDLNPLEEARAYEFLASEAGLTQEQIAERVGRERSTVANYLRLLALPERIQEFVISDSLSMGHARALLGLKTPGAQIRLAETVVLHGLSVRQTEARVRAMRQEASKPGANVQQDPDTLVAQKRLERALGAPVKIHGKEKGRIEVRFSSLEELERLYEQLLSSTGGSNE
ncbi:MAG: ParB/RepB/Spo0J family partition protein [Acidobacteriota bacterium]|nr:ParB/RepB/Spo0J family partition protein [Acidobacteriota bacterium]